MQGSGSNAISHTVHLQGPPRAVYTFAPLGLQFLGVGLERIPDYLVNYLLD